MSLALLVAAGLMAQSITRLRDLDYGFDPGAVFTAQVGLFDAEFPDSLARRRFYDELGRPQEAIDVLEMAAGRDGAPRQRVNRTPESAAISPSIGSFPSSELMK